MGWEYGIQCIEEEGISKEQQARQLIEQLSQALVTLDLGDMVIEQVDDGLVITDPSYTDWPDVAQIQVEQADLAIESIAEGEVYIHCLFHRHDVPVRRMIDTIQTIISTEDQWIEL
ncbi:hypothetical protein QCD85_01395 [Paenibacillus sp. PsM32]|uniref:hypothetical protein n=1 Tax=Paenibacillus sp. PsM32 TaxID=3030536 RepID=UPI00263AA415|nr:hypothetical protein [Paenibacillus sp. PsM32]MDN4616733.1 hypothetical protein [Paenibacillus sp. PsM32]